MTDLIVQVNPRLLSGGLDGLERALAAHPATVPAADSLVAFTDLLPVHLDPGGFLASLFTGSQDGPAYPFLRHMGLPHILSFFNYDCEWAADPGFWDVINPSFAGQPSFASGPQEALRNMLEAGEGGEGKRALLLFSSALDSAEVVRQVAASGRADRTCIVFVGVPAALVEASLGERAHHLALRFPAAIAFPGRLSARRITTPLSGMDLLPTLLEVIGLPPFLRKDAAPIEGTSHYGNIRSGEPIVPRTHHIWLPSKPRRVSQRGHEKLVVDERGLRLHFIDRDPAEEVDALGANRDTWIELADSLLAAEDRLSTGK